MSAKLEIEPTKIMIDRVIIVAKYVEPLISVLTGLSGFGGLKLYFLFAHL